MTQLIRVRIVDIPGQASFQGNNYDSEGITIPTLEVATSLYAQILPVLEEVGPTSVTIYFNGKCIYESDGRPELKFLDVIVVDCLPFLDLGRRKGRGNFITFMSIT